MEGLYEALGFSLRNPALVADLGGRSNSWHETFGDFDGDGFPCEQ